jgi:hypothetical protein
VIGGTIYLVIAVFKLPLLAIVSVILGWGFLVTSFLFFVGKMSPAREYRRYE